MGAMSNKAIRGRTWLFRIDADLFLALGYDCGADDTNC